MHINLNPFDEYNSKHKIGMLEEVPIGA